MSCLEHQLIVCGGAGRVPIDGPSAPRHLSSVESYCLETEQWTYLTPMRFEACSPTATGKQYIYLATRFSRLPSRPGKP